MPATPHEAISETHLAPVCDSLLSAIPPLVYTPHMDTSAVVLVLGFDIFVLAIPPPMRPVACRRQQCRYHHA
ncbi:hypothetical protein PENSPDRAFT_646896 [Peniophora sp. CONT]|nr:hypothetical protein PENSPDRAFT_646896 [Peniophora sp. CONT]